jgi:hypothetical protein
MDKAQMDRREELLRQKESIQRRKATGSKREVAGELENIVRRLHALALEADAAGGEPIERARTWRLAADTQLEIAGDRDLEKITEAVASYKRAEALMEGSEDSRERILIEYGYGRALLGMVRCGDVSFVDEAKRRFACVQAIARPQQPELNELIPKVLVHLQLIANIIEEREALWRDIDRREKSRADEDATGSGGDPQAPQDALLFERLLELCQRVSQVRNGDL